MKSPSNVMVTWLGSVTYSKRCIIRTDYINAAYCIVFSRENDHDFVIEIKQILNLFLDSSNPKQLRINGQTVRLAADFADSRQASAWLHEIKQLKNSPPPTTPKSTVSTQNVPVVTSASVPSKPDKMEIPSALRADVKLAVFEAGILGPIGAFSSIADVASIAGWWGFLLVQYSKYYGIQLDLEAAKKVCSTALLGMGGYYLGCKTATKLFHLIPGAGTLAAMGISSLQNVIFTYRFAVTLTRIFREGTVSFDTLSNSIIGMFAGTGAGFLSVKNIWDLYVHY